VVTALIKQSKKLPDELYKSLTWDRGKELADHQRFTLKRMWMFTFAIHVVRGNVDPTRILIDC
jgi:IS30 family transposase